MFIIFCHLCVAQVIVAIISFLETMLLMYLSYKVRHTHTTNPSTSGQLQNTVPFVTYNL